MRETVWFDPPYQRLSDVWPIEKRQLLIDSIINGYDIPKLYFHEFFPPKKVGRREFKYAIIDGKQRLDAIFSFIEGQFGLDSAIELIADPKQKLGGLTYAELARQFPHLKTKFDGFVLPIITILTDDTELIEDMFSRLNEAVPLNSAEKRNALGGPLPVAIREMIKHRFFAKKLPFDNRRYRQYDLAAKFLYVTHQRHLTDTKKIHLDAFVKANNSPQGIRETRKIKLLANKVLDKMASTFIDKDPLLRSLGTDVLYFFLFLESVTNKWDSNVSRSDVLAFEQRREKNRKDAEKDVSKANFSLLEFDRLTQTPNDAVALKFRYSVLRQYLGPARGRPTVLKIV